MWTLTNTKNNDALRFDEAETCIAVFEIMKREGYSCSVRSPDGTIVNWW